MILTREKLAFIHAQKTAGTAMLGCWVDDAAMLDHRINYAEWITCNRDRLRSELGVVLPGRSLHRTLHLTKNDITRAGEDPLSYSYFTIVRDPWDALRSAHRYNIKIGILTRNAKFDPTAHVSMLRFYANVASCGAANLFDYVLRFETLKEDFVAMCDEQEIEPPRTIGHWNVTQGRKDVAPTIPLEYTSEDYDVLQPLLSEYCQTFNYSPHP